MQPKRQIDVLGKTVFAQGIQIEDDHSAISVWVRDKGQELGNAAPDVEERNNVLRHERHARHDKPQHLKLPVPGLCRGRSPPHEH